MNRDHHLVAQGAAAVVASEISRLQSQCIDQLAHQDQNRALAQTEVGEIRSFIERTEHIQGNANTKGGEIAEVMDFRQRNAMDMVNGLAPSARKHEARNGPIDYYVGEIGFQSKFHNSTPNTMDGVRHHLNDYPDFPKTGDAYRIPKDQYEEAENALAFKAIDGISEKTARAIRGHVRHIEETTGRRYGDVIQSSNFTYPEAQRGNVVKTVDGIERRIDSEHDNIRQRIRTDNQPGWQAAGTAAAKGAAIGGALRLGTGIWRKAQEGRNVFYGELTVEDWSELGVETAIGAAQGGVAAGGIFLLTQQAGLAAPFAGAFVSTAIGFATLAADYHNQKISSDEFVELGLLNCFEGAVVGLAAVAGQTLIPIPLVGAMIGSLAGRLFVSLGKDFLAEQDTALATRLAEFNEACLSRLSSAYRDLVEQIDRHFEELGGLTNAAFDVSLNAELRFAASFRLAQAYGVQDGRTVQSLDHLDKYMRE